MVLICYEISRRHVLPLLGVPSVTLTIFLGYQSSIEILSMIVIRQEEAEKELGT